MAQIRALAAAVRAISEGGAMMRELAAAEKASIDLQGSERLSACIGCLADRRTARSFFTYTAFMQVWYLSSVWRLLT